MTKIYRIEVTEYYRTMVDVEASTEEEALAAVQKSYDDGEFDLNRNCYDGMTMRVDGWSDEPEQPGWHEFEPGRFTWDEMEANP